MKSPLTRYLLMAVLLAGGATWQASAQMPPSPQSQSGPQIKFTELEHDFGKIEGGTSVKFDFVFTNTGTATLEVTEVRPSCGCTTTGAWSKSVAPGQTGTIPIQFNSGAFSGPIQKTVTVTSNTPGQPQTVLNLKGAVWKAIDVTPTTAYFTPQAEATSSETKVVRIVNNTDVPLELSQPECGNNAYTAELETLKEGKEFEVRISAKPPFDAANLQGVITLKTSSKSLPVITINGIAMVQLPITAAPPQVVLGPAPLAVATKVGVTLRNSGSAAVSVFEPSVNVPGGEATVKELQPGRVFSITLSFPAGCDFKSATPAELSVKTSHPQYPIVRVPIFQGSQTFQPQPGAVPPRSPIMARAPAISDGGAMIEFAEMEHDFGKIDNGASVNFDYVFSNKGTTPLVISEVQSTCTCLTIGAWSKVVAPGQRGTIPILLDSGKLSGAIHKVISIASNSAVQPRLILTVKATVWRAIDVTPSAVYFTPQADAKTVETNLVRIMNNSKVPLELSPPECSNPAFTAELKTLKEGKEFEVRVSAKPPFGPGTTPGSITLKTSSKDLPVLTIDGLIMVQTPIIAMPPQLVLGPAPLAIATKLAVIVRNSGSAAVSVSEPSVNVPGVEATVRELQPGRMFQIVLSFPAGCNLKPTATAELSVKTSHPQYPIVRVPIAHGPQASQGQVTQVPPRPISVTDAAAIPPPQPVAATQLQPVVPAPLGK